MLEVIRKSALADRFAALPEGDREGILSDYGLCADAVSLLVALWDDKRVFA